MLVEMVRIMLNQIINGDERKQVENCIALGNTLNAVEKYGRKEDAKTRPGQYA
jgi:hypothetical protein